MSLVSSVAYVRSRSGLSLRALAERAQTSHTTIAAYEHRRKVPGVETLERVIASAGFSVEMTVVSLPHLASESDADAPDLIARGRQLEAALELAEAFPRPKRRRPLRAPVFARP